MMEEQVELWGFTVRKEQVKFSRSGDGGAVSLVERSQR